MRPRELQNDDSRAGKVGSKTITAGLQRGLNETVRSAFVRNTQKLVQKFGLFGTADPCARLPCVIMTHDAAVAERVLRCRPAFVVWSVARDLADLVPVGALGEPGVVARLRRPPDLDGLTPRIACSPLTPHARAVGDYHEGRPLVQNPGAVGVPAERFDPDVALRVCRRCARRRARVLVTRFEDMADLPEIARDVVPEFAPDFSG